MYFKCYNIFLMKNNKRITLQKIASAAGCSVAVASRALSSDVLQNRTVAPDTAAHIVAVARQLGWTPRTAYKKKRALGVVGALLPGCESPLMQDLLDGLNAVAQQNNTPVYHYSRATGESFRQFWDDHASGSHQVGAVSYYPAERSEVPAFMEMFEKFRKREAPLVIVHNNAPEDFPAVSVRIDNIYGGRLAGKHLVDLNCSNNFLLGFGYTPYRYDRLKGCSEVLNENRLPYTCISCKPNTPNEFELVKQLEHLINGNFDEPVGVFVDGMYLALMVHNYFQSQGVEIGKKLKLIAYDDSLWMQCAYPAITAVRQPFYEMGALAMKKLFNMLRGYSEKSEYIKPELIVRQSTVPEIL